MISTQILTDASSMMETSLLVDKVDIFDVGAPITVGFEVETPLDPAFIGFPALVQTTTLNNAVESAVENTYSIKLPSGVAVKAGQVVEIVECDREPSFVGKKLLIDKISQNGLALIRKAVAHDYEVVNQEGKLGF